jgi:hypothetical protein
MYRDRYMENMSDSESRDSIDRDIAAVARISAVPSILRAICEKKLTWATPRLLG